MNCLVLGGNGFIGQHLVKRLLADGHKVRVFGRAPGLNCELSDYAQQIDYVSGDFAGDGDLESAIKNIDIVYHLISTTIPQTSNDAPIYDIESNLLPILKLFDLAGRFNVDKIIFSSSGGTVYGIPQQTPITELHPTMPICSYGIVKLAVEHYLHLYSKKYGFDYAVLRLSNPYGFGQNIQCGQGVVSAFLAKSLSNEIIEVLGDGSVVRDYIYIDDVIDAFIKAANTKSTNKIFNIGTGAGISLNDLLSVIEAVVNKKIERRYLAARAFDVPANILDVSCARQNLGWEAQTPIDVGIMKTLASMRKNVAAQTTTNEVI